MLCLVSFKFIPQPVFFLTIKVINPNNNPTTTNLTIVTPMIGNSTSFSLSGADVDPADTFSTLVVVLDQLPSRGTLVQVGGGDVTTLRSFPNGASFYLRGDANKGSAQVSFHIVDGILNQSFFF